VIKRGLTLASSTSWRLS